MDNDSNNLNTLVTIDAKPVASNGSMNPNERPTDATFFTHAFSYLPVLNSTPLVGYTPYLSVNSSSIFSGVVNFKLCTYPTDIPSQRGIS